MVTSNSLHSAAAEHPGPTAWTHGLLLFLQGSAVIVDIRSLREKEAGGAPDLPNACEQGWCLPRASATGMQHCVRMRGARREPAACLPGCCAIGQ